MSAPGLLLVIAFHLLTLVQTWPNHDENRSQPTKIVTLKEEVIIDKGLSSEENDESLKIGEKAQKDELVNEEKLAKINGSELLSSENYDGKSGKDYSSNCPDITVAEFSRLDKFCQHCYELYRAAEIFSLCR